MKVIGYTRVSTEEQATQGVSLAAQADKLRAYAALYDLELVDVVEDAGQSAKTLNRPGLQRVLELLRTGQAEGLLVAKLDRLTRSVADMAHLINDYFGDRARHQVTLLSVADQVDTRTASGRLVLNILSSVSQWEREAIGERTRAALAHLKQAGVKLGAPPLTDATTIARIVALRHDGMTYRQIATALQTEGRPTMRGGRWGPETIRKVLGRQTNALAVPA
ncbi:MAG TPA: recombinase family protein [Candidatus Xenobia bacterium]|jgi:DNA invertase Pin-like site-specific DNA recombinase